MSGFGLVSLGSAIWRPTLPPCIFCGTILTCVQTTQMNSNDLSMFFFIPPVPNEEGIRASRGRHRLQDQGHVRCGHLEGLSSSSSTIPTARKVTQNLGEVFVIHQSEGHLQGFLFLNHSTLWHNVAWCKHDPWDFQVVLELPCAALDRTRWIGLPTWLLHFNRYSLVPYLLCMPWAQGS